MTDDDAQCPPEHRPFVLAATILASAMGFIDGSIVALTLPIVQVDLDAPFGAVQWVVSSYALVMGGLILVGGAAGDRFGRRRVFSIGLAVFALASVLCALAPDIGTLIAGRIAKGFGAALMIPQSLAIIAASWPASTRGRAIGLWAGLSAAATALGPPLGGFLIDAFDWRAVYWISVPLAGAALLLAARYVPECRDGEEKGPLDLAGAGLAVIACAAPTLALTLGAEQRAHPALLGGLFTLGCATAWAFVRVERRARAPLTPLALFDAPGFAAANVLTLFIYGALTGALFLLPFDLIERRGLTALQLGLTLTPLGLIIGAVSPLAGRWTDRAGPRNALVFGSVAATFGIAGLAAPIGSFWMGVMVPLVALGVGMGLVSAPLSTAVMNSAPDHLSGAASGVNNAAARLSGLFAVAIVGAVALTVYGLGAPAGAPRFGVLPEPGAPGRDAAVAAFGDAYMAAMAVSALAAALAAFIGWRYLRTEKQG